MRRWREVATGVCLWMAAACAQADDTQRVVFIAHTAGGVDADVPPQRHWRYAALSPAATARNSLSALQIRPVWARAPDAAGAPASGSDTGDGTPGATGTGFDLQLAADGSVLTPRGAQGTAIPADLRLGALALRPVVLPSALRAGIRLDSEDRSGDHAGLHRTLRVRTVDATVAVLDLDIQGAGLQGHGRQAVRIDDGQPLETRLYLEHAVGGTAPEVHRLHVVDMATRPVLDLELDDAMARDYVERTHEMLEAPPFSAPSDDPAQYQPHPTPEGALEPWMPAAGGSELEAMLLVAVQRAPDGGRPRIVLGADGRAIGDTGAPIDAFVSLRARTVELRDAAGRPLPGIDATIVQPTLPMSDRQRIEDTQLGFPFRVLADTSPDALWTLDSVRMTGDVEAYRWDHAETVARDTTHTGNDDAHIEWTTPYRATLVQDAWTLSRREGLWTTAVPVDADGNEIPSAQFTTGRSLDMPGDWRTPATLPPLAYESQRMPLRLEIATATPIAGLRLRHYRWRDEPRTWTFHDFRKRLSDAERAAYEHEFGRNASMR